MSRLLTLCVAAFLLLRLDAFVIPHAYSTNVPVCKTHRYHWGIFIRPETRRYADAPTSTSTPSGDELLRIGLTREEGKNSQLEELLTKHPMVAARNMELSIREVPCIQHADGDDYPAFLELLTSGGLEGLGYCIITSPEAARVFGRALEDTYVSVKEVTQSGITLAAVGAATSAALEDLGFDDVFVPSKATGETLAEELPVLEGYGDEAIRVLYPCSAKAADTIPTNLEERRADKPSDGSGRRGYTPPKPLFQVTRLNTYDTVPVTLPNQLISGPSQNGSFDVLCFGSPSAVNAWLENVDRVAAETTVSDVDDDGFSAGNGNVIACCIGKTTAQACLGRGRWTDNDIYYPEKKPGLKGWSDSTAICLGDILKRRF